MLRRNAFSEFKKVTLSATPKKIILKEARVAPLNRIRWLERPCWGKEMKQGPTRWLVVALLLLFAPLTFSLAEEPPAGFTDDIKNIITSAYNVTFTNRGWGSVYDLPQSEFSVDDIDFYDNSADFGELGFYAFGLQSLLNPLYDDLDLNAGIPQQIASAANQSVPWVWTPGSIGFGTQHKGKLPHNGISIVREKLQGIVGTDNTCVNSSSIAYNYWGLPKDTINKQTTSLLSSLAGGGQLFLYAAQHETDPTKKENYTQVANGIGDMLLTMIVTPEGETFGIHPSQLVDKRGKSMPEGMMPYQFTLKDEEDTPLCTDGGTIKIHENKKGMMAQAALLLHELGMETGKTEYEKAFQIISNGMLNLQECDGTYKDYTRWEGPGAVPTTCTPDDGSPAYEAYPPNVVISETRGFITDSALLLYLLSKGNPELYQQNQKFKAGVLSLLDLEERETGSGLARNGDPLKYASYSINTTDRPFAQIVLGTLFLRASCQETDAEVEKRLQKKGFSLINKASVLIPGELDAKIGKAIAPDVGLNMFAISAAAEAWKIADKGCQECKDLDGDDYIDGTCAGDTVKYDCNDNDAMIHPGASEVCDQIDNDCDGKVDNGYDNDDDGVSTCAEPKDCNDENNEVYPGALEKVDGLDNDCDAKADNTGIEITLQNDVNVGISNVEMMFIDYGNACANSFAVLAKSIPQIKEQCSTVASCTTDSNGMCLAEIKKNGKYQALANIPGNGAVSLPIEFSPGQRIPLLMKADVNTTAIEDQNKTMPSPSNPFLNNPSVIVGVIILGLVGALILGFYLIKTGDLKPPKGFKMGEMVAVKKGSGPTPLGPKPSPKEETKTPPKEMAKEPRPGFWSKLKLPTLPKIENKPTQIVLKVPKVSASKLAEKIVSGKPIGSKLAEKMNKPTNFPPKRTTQQTKKVWKNE